MEFITDFRNTNIDMTDAYKYISSNKKNLFLTHDGLIEYINKLSNENFYVEVSKEIIKHIRETIFQITPFRKKIIFIPDINKEDVNLFIEGEDNFLYVLYSVRLQSGHSSIIITGGKDCDSVKLGGSGNSIRTGSGSGDSYRYANVSANTFIGNCIRDGNGTGDAVSSGFCISNSLKLGKGEGNSYNYTCMTDIPLLITNNIPTSMNDKGNLLSLKYEVDKLTIPNILISNRKDLNLSLGYIIEYYDFIKEYILNVKEDASTIEYEIESKDVSLIVSMPVLLEHKKSITFTMNGFKDGSIEVRNNGLSSNTIIVVRSGAGNGSAILSGKGHGNILRLGSGDGHAIAMGVINGYVRNTTSGVGEVYKEGGLGEPKRLKSNDTR